MRRLLIAALCIMARPAMAEVTTAQVKDEIANRVNYFAHLKTEQGDDDQMITLACLADGTFAIETEDEFGNANLEAKIDDGEIMSGNRVIWQWDPKSPFLNALRGGSSLILKKEGGLRSFRYNLAGIVPALEPFKKQCGV